MKGMAMKETAWNGPNLWHIWIFRWQRRGAATNTASTDCNLPTQRWPDQNNWTARGNLSHQFFCPGKVQQGWLGRVPAGADSNANLLTRQYSCSVLALIITKFPLPGFQTVSLDLPSHWCPWRFPERAALSCLSQFMVTDAYFFTDTLKIF